MNCDCTDVCKRSGYWRNGEMYCSYFTPYLPTFVEGHEKVCKHLPMRKLEDRPTLGIRTND